MRLMLMLLIGVLTVTDVFGLDSNLAPGLSAKNFVMYMLGFVLILRVVVGGVKIKYELRSLHAAFLLLVGYAILTWLIAGLIIHYQSYKLLDSGITLKAGLADHFIIFLLYFYGTQSSEDARAIIKTLLLAVAFANAIAIVDAAAGLTIGVSTVGDEGEEAGRVFGAFGHANETAALTVCLLPAYAGMILYNKGVRRLLWIAVGAISTTLFFLNGSRGGFVGLLLGGLMGIFVCRQHLSARTVVKWLVIAVIALVPIAWVIHETVGGVLIERVTSTFLQLGARQEERTDIWLPGIYRMMEYPVTLFTGFGWDTWVSMGFLFVAHNHYLKLWFELGLVGLLSYLWVIRMAVGTALRAIPIGSEALRSELTAFIFGILMMSVAIAFTLIARPWPYIWAYVGVAMRLAINGLNQHKATAQAKQTVKPTAAGIRLGWQARPARSAN